nr:hypothetical protein [Candidatus Njordarchaeota archaeon]
MVEATDEVKERQPQPQPEEGETPQAESGEKTEEKPTLFACDMCPKVFEREGSLKAHKLRVHRISPNPQVSQEAVKHAPGEAPTPRVQESPPSTTYPTDRDHLHNLLTKLRFSRVDAAVEACDIRGYTVTAVYDVLREMNASEAITRSAVSYWSRVKGEAIPYSIKARLGIRDVVDDYQSRYDGGYGYGYGYGYPPQRHDGDILTGVGNLIRAIKEDGGLSQQGDNEQVISLQNQVSSLQKELHELKEDQAKREVQALRQEIGELKELVKKNSGDETLKFLDKRFAQLGSKTDRLIGTLEPLSRAYGRRVYESYTGEPLPPQANEGQERGKRSLISMIPPELIEEEAQKEAGEEQP